MELSSIDKSKLRFRPGKLVVLLGAIFLLGGGAWYLYQTDFPVQSDTEDITNRSGPKKLPWPADIGAYEFVAPDVRVIATKCDAIARRVYLDLVHDNYDDAKRNVISEAIVARWYVADENGFPVPATRAQSRTRSGSIHLVKDRTGKICDATMIGDCGSADGWAASVQYSVVRKSWFHIVIFSSSLPNDFNGEQRINLVNPVLQTGTSHSKARPFSVTFESALFTPAELTQQPMTGAAISPFFQSAESLRDETLRRIGMLEEKTRQQIQSGSGFTETDWSDVRSDNPPRPYGVSDVSAEVKHICLQQATKILAERRAVIRKHYRAIHQVVVDAFPFASVIVEATDAKE